MKDDAATRAQAYVASHHVMTLATHGPLGLWAAAVFYAHEDFRLVFLSARHTRHAQNMTASPHVAATIQDDYAEWQAIQGIQLEGKVRLLSGRERLTAAGMYAGRFRFLASPTAVVEAALQRISWYSLEPERLYFVDNTQGFGHRDEITL